MDVEKLETAPPLPGPFPDLLSAPPIYETTVYCRADLQEPASCKIFC